jgi:hypothetical protein
LVTSASGRVKPFKGSGRRDNSGVRGRDGRGQRAIWAMTASGAVGRIHIGIALSLMNTHDLLSSLK